MALTLGEIADNIDAELQGDPARAIANVAPLHQAGREHLSFLANRRYLAFLKTTGAAAVIVAAADAPACPAARLICADPYLAYAKAARLLNPEAGFEPGVHHAATVAADARLAPDCLVGPQVVVGRGAVIGARTRIDPGCVIDEQVSIGADCRLRAGATLLRGARVGDRVVIFSGAVIGAEGYGFAQDEGKWLKIPQLGGVVIEDDVEIGANTTIDRGALGDTVIETGVKIDNQVQIGHNVRVGAHTAIAGAVAIAGSAKLGRRCQIGGACAINGHIEIADDVTITGMSGVANDIKQAGVYSGGAPVVSSNLTWRKNMARFKQLDQLARRLFALERSASTPSGRERGHG